MSKLSHEQAILLDTFIYLRDTNSKKHTTIRQAIHFFEQEGLEKNMDEKSGQYPAQLTKEQWIDTLNLIKKDEYLMNMKIEHVEDRSFNPDGSMGSGLKAMVLKDSDGKSIVAFRGTSNDKEWVDNGRGMYMSDTEHQKETLEFFNDMVKKYNLDGVTVTGHSKGGNRAQYVVEEISENSNTLL